MTVKNLSYPSVPEENAIDDMVNGLYRRIISETERLLTKQFEALGVDPVEAAKETQKVDYPNDPYRLADYIYQGKVILSSRIADNRMAIEWDIPKLPEPEAPKCRRYAPFPTMGCKESECVNKAKDFIVSNESDGFLRRFTVGVSVDNKEDAQGGAE